MKLSLLIWGMVGGLFAFGILAMFSAGILPIFAAIVIGFWLATREPESRERGLVMAFFGAGVSMFVLVLIFSPGDWPLVLAALLFLAPRVIWLGKPEAKRSGYFLAVM